jgi:hypothetical protein
LLLYNKMQPRYEFRVWGENLQPLKTTLEQRDVPQTTISNETYLLSLQTDKCNAKIRNGTLEIKFLLEEHRGLEQWQPVLRSAFPVARSVISQEFFSRVEVEPPQLLRPHYDVQEFLNEVIAARLELATVEVSKRRSKFRLDRSMAEFTIISFEHIARHTVAVESVDADQMLRLIAELGLQSAENISYIRYLRCFVENKHISGK